MISLRLEGDLDRYLDQVRQQPLLSPEEERELAERHRDEQDPRAAEKLLGSHLRLVVKIARGYRGYGLPAGELIAEGNVGLVQALGKFDPDRGFRFATYAMWWIRAAIQEHILHNWSLVKMGTTAGQKKLFFNLRRIKSQLGELGGGDLPPETVATIARELAVDVDEVVTMNRRLAGGDASLSMPTTEDGDREWVDTLVDDTQNQADRVAEHSELSWRRGLMARAMAGLNQRERHIIEERRLKDDPVTLEELAQVYGVSRERIRQIEARAFDKLQAAVIAAAANDTGIPALAA
jgi:RNA polymerase sigma-32 factor